MPQPVAELEEPQPVLGREDVAVFVEVGEIGDAGPKPLLLAPADVPGRRIILERAELAGKGELLLVTERLVAEHQHSIGVHACFDRCDFVRVERPAAIDGGNLAGKARSERADRYRHVVSAPCLCAIDANAS